MATAQVRFWLKVLKVERLYRDRAAMAMSDEGKRRKVECDEARLEEIMSRIVSNMLKTHVTPSLDKLHAVAAKASSDASEAKHGLQQLDGRLDTVDTRLGEVEAKVVSLNDNHQKLLDVEQQLQEVKAGQNRRQAQASKAPAPPDPWLEAARRLPTARMEVRSNASTASSGFPPKDKFACMVVGGYGPASRKQMIVEFLNSQVKSQGCEQHVDRIACYKKRRGPGFIYL